MEKYKIKIRLKDKDFETEIEGENWEQVCDYVFGNIEIIDTQEN